ncbi:MAG: HlyC/CorC family transporter [Candidatus Methanomethylophilaceae archaeon]|nr:HlyC/CorC family transporter [Candidatus Methanomethylophilaceae archaeon]
MDQLILWASVALVFLVALSGMFSATETAFTGANRIKLKKLAEDGSKKAEKALRLIENYDSLLTTILVGNNLVNILSSALCTYIFTGMFGSLGVIYATLFMLVVILALGEITPKSLAKANAERFAVAMAPIMSVLTVVFSPITWIFQKFSGAVAKRTNDPDDSPTLTEEELRIMVDEIEEEGEIEEAESNLIKSAMEFDDKTVSEILTPRVDIVAVDKTTTMEQLKEVFLRSGYSRIPVFNGTVDQIVGVVYSKDFYQKYLNPGNDQRIGDIIRRVRFIPESTTVAKALAEIQRSSVQMLVVIDDYGGTVGMVSLEDVLEELVGEIWDEDEEMGGEEK